jgi:hypothetical protein
MSLMMIIISNLIFTKDNYTILRGTYSSENSFNILIFYGSEDKNKFCYYIYDTNDNKYIEEEGYYSYDETKKSIILTSNSFNNSKLTSKNNGKSIHIQVNGEEHTFGLVSQAPIVIE